MKLRTNKVPEIVSEFLLTRVVAKAPTSAAQFGFGFLVPYVSRSAKSMAESPLLKSLGVVDAEGSIDLDTARNSAIEALEKAGGKVTMYGVTFDSTDIDALFEMARKYSDS